MFIHKKAIRIGILSSTLSLCFENENSFCIFLHKCTIASWCCCWLLLQLEIWANQREIFWEKIWKNWHIMKVYEFVGNAESLPEKLWVHRISCEICQNRYDSLQKFNFFSTFSFWAFFRCSTFLSLLLFRLLSPPIASNSRSQTFKK